MLKNFIVLALLVLAASACQDKGDHATPSALDTLDTSVFGSGGGGGEVGISAPCVIRPVASVGIKSEVAGKVNSVRASVGDQVVQGQVLAQIDTSNQSNEIERLSLVEKRAEADIALASLQVERARRVRQVMRDINSNDASTRQELLKARENGLYSVEELILREKETLLSQNKLALQGFKLETLNLKRSIEKATIRSPLSGVVLSRAIEEGSVVGAGTIQLGGGDILFEVADVHRLRAECFARESEATAINVGSPMGIALDSDRLITVETKIDRVAPSIELVSGVPRLKFESEFSPANKRWLAGLSATALIHSKSPTKSNLLPRSAVREEAGRYFAFVRKGSKLEKQEVAAEPTEHGWQVSRGLKGGDLIVVDYGRALDLYGK